MVDSGLGMDDIPSAAVVLDDALGHGASSARVVRALVHVAREAAASAAEGDPIDLLDALRPALTALLSERSPEDASGVHGAPASLDVAEEQVHAALTRARRRAQGDSSIAAAESAALALALTRRALRAEPLDRNLAARVLERAESAIDRRRTWPRTPADQVACTLAAMLPCDRPEWPDYDQVAARMLRPRTPSLEAARRALDGVNDGAEAWEVLAARGLIPLEWAGDGGRSFRGRARDPRGRPVRSSTRHPPDVASALALGANPDGVLAAERLAREFAATLGAWDVLEPTHFAWEVLDRRAMFDAFRGPWPVALERALRRIPLSTPERAWAEGRAAAASSVEGPDAYVPAGLREALSLTELWRVMVELGARFVRESTTPASWFDARVAEVPCAFAALLGLWELGYGLILLDGERAFMAAPAAA
jgi:hypothetical protein